MFMVRFTEDADIKRELLNAHHTILWIQNNISAHHHYTSNTDKYQYLSPTRMSSYITMKVPLNIIYFLGTPVSSTNKTDRHDVTEILMKVALNTISHQYHIICMQNIYHNQFHCNIVFLIKIFLENFFNFTFQQSTNDQS